MFTSNSNFLGFKLHQSRRNVSFSCPPSALSRLFFLHFRSFRPQKHIKKIKNLSFTIPRVHRSVITAPKNRGWMNLGGPCEG